MEVCIFGVLTVNLLTFSSQNAPSPNRTPLSRCLLKEDWLSLGRKVQTPCYSPFYGLI